MLYFSCVYPAILTLMARYILMKLLLIHTGKSESGVKIFILSVSVYTASFGGRVGGKIQHSLCQCRLQFSPAGTEDEG